MSSHLTLRTSVLLCALVGIPCAHAEVVPKGSAFDERVQVVMYNPSDVVQIQTKVGVATLIQLQPGEDLTTPAAGLGMGDADAWKLSVHGNNIFLKPTEAHPDTNVTVVTNRRTYLFSLETAKRDTPPTYILRFAYPQDAPVATVPTPPPCSNGPQNFAYYSWGDNDISPNRVWDDGQFTCFAFSNSVDLPVIFKKMADGTEALVNTWKQKDVVIVHEVSPEYRLRLGDRVLGIKTTAFAPAPYNARGTSDSAQRVVQRPPQD